MAKELISAGTARIYRGCDLFGRMIGHKLWTTRSLDRVITVTGHINHYLGYFGPVRFRGGTSVGGILCRPVEVALSVPYSLAERHWDCLQMDVLLGHGRKR